MGDLFFLGKRWGVVSREFWLGMFSSDYMHIYQGSTKKNMLHARIIPLKLENCWEFTRAFYQRCIDCHRLLPNWYWARKNNLTKCTPPTSPFLSIWSFSNGISWYHPPFLLIFVASRVKNPSPYRQNRLIGHASPNFARLEFQLPLCSKPRWSLSSVGILKVLKVSHGKNLKSPLKNRPSGTRKLERPTVVSFSSPIHFSRRKSCSTSGPCS